MPYGVVEIGMLRDHFVKAHGGICLWWRSLHYFSDIRILLNSLRIQRNKNALDNTLTIISIEALGYSSYNSVKPGEFVRFVCACDGQIVNDGVNVDAFCPKRKNG